MNRKLRNSLIITGLIAAAGLAAFILASVLWARTFYPKADRMPPPVARSMDELLEQFEEALAANTSGIIHRLQPGLTDEQINVQEARGSIALGSELRSLYQWKNGLTGEPDPGIMEGHSFPPLEQVVDEILEQRRQIAELTGGTRFAWNLFAGHRTGWIPIFTDGAGDGYFHDPGRKLDKGAYFHNFAEIRGYVFFPSLRNIIRGFIDGYESKAIRQTMPGELEIDYSRMEEIWRRYGEANLQGE